MFICYILLFISPVLVFADDSSLRLVNLVYRHGDRSPTEIYPTDPNQEDKWPQGLGWLSKIGMLQQYHLGQWLRVRYMDSGYMNNTYRREEIQVHSSSVDRCLMSAYSNLAGLYPPDDAEKFNPNISWQPVPVFSKPIEEDNMLALGVYCPRYVKLYLETLASKAVKDVEKRNKVFYEFLGNMTHWSHENISNVWKIFDVSNCEKSHNMTLPAWLNSTVFDKLLELDSLQFTLLYSGQEKSMLAGGPLLSQYISNMNTTITDPSLKTKMFMYSGHDSTVAAHLSALGVFDDKSPGYATMVIAELHEKPKGKFYVNLFYKNETYGDTAYPVTLPNCTVDCPFADFVRLTKAEVPTNWAVQCGLPGPSVPGSKLATGWIVSIALGGVLVVFVVVSVICFIRIGCRRDTVQYGKFDVST